VWNEHALYWNTVQTASTALLGNKQSSSSDTMLGKIPRRLTAPFGLLGDEAKLAFSTQPGGVAKLATVRVSDEALQLIDNLCRRFSRISLRMTITGTRSQRFLVPN
jgi:hypothetical protein